MNYYDPELASGNDAVAIPQREPRGVFRPWIVTLGFIGLLVGILNLMVYPASYLTPCVILDEHLWRGTHACAWCCVRRQLRLVPSTLVR